MRILAMCGYDDGLDALQLKTRHIFRPVSRRHLHSRFRQADLMQLPVSFAHESARAPLVGFVARALAIFALWFVVYDLWLLPDGRIDEVLSQGVARISGGALALLGGEVAVSGRLVRLDGAPGIVVENGCNGLTTLGLFVGFVLAYPGSWRRRAAFIPMGLAVIAVVTIVRVAGLAWIQVHAPGLFGAAHGVGANTVFYLTVFALWIVWARTSDAHAARTVPPTAVPA